MQQKGWCHCPRYSATKGPTSMPLTSTASRLVDLITLFLAMWLSSWYQLCMSLPVEVRTLFWSCSVSASPDPTLCFVRLSASRSCWTCVHDSNSAFSAAVRRSNSELFASCATPLHRYARHDLLSRKSLPHLPPSSPRSWSHCYHISALRETCPEIKPRRSRRGGFIELFAPGG